MAEPNPNIQQEEEIDIVWLIRYVLDKRKLILYAVGIAFVIFTLLFFTKSKQYNSTASILPVSSRSSMSSNMGMLASMTGMNMGMGAQAENVITPDLYPAVASSTPFMRKLITVPLKWKDKDTVMSAYEYAKLLEPSFIDIVKSYTIGLPTTLANLISPPITPNIDAILASNDVASANSDPKESSFIIQDSYERTAISLLMSMLVVEEDRSINAINVSATCEVPEQAAVLASSALDILQEIVTEYKTKRSSLALKFIEERYQLVNEDYEQIRKKYYAYKDSHRNMIDERVDVEYQQLSDQYELSYGLLKTIANQMEEAKLNVMEETPVFTILQPAILPSAPCAPNIVKYMLVGIAMGLFLSLGWLIANIVYLQVFNEKKYKALKAQYEIKETEEA